MKNLIINLLLKAIPKLIVESFDKFEPAIIKFVEGTEYEIDDAMYVALKAAVNALRNIL